MNKYETLKALEDLSSDTFIVSLGVVLGTIVGICLSIPLLRFF